MECVKNNLIYLLMFFCFCIFVYMDYRYLDLEFLAFSNGDEFMQYHSLLRMYEGIINLNLEDLFRFDSYVYGFVWHLLNLIFVIPFHITNNTEMAILMPRILSGIISICCLFMIFKIARLFLNYFYSYGIVLIIALMPGFYIEGYVFKPNVFQALLLLVSVYFLCKDNFLFKRNFYFGVLFFGLSVGLAKIQAIMFLPLIYFYIFCRFLSKPNFENFKFILKYCIFSTLAIIFVFLLTNPYILHPRGFNAWWWLFLHNMESNATNHGSYIDVSFSDKIFDVIDFYYFEIIVFVFIILFSIFYLYRFYKTKSLDVFFPIIISVLISFLYLFLFVNKAWSGYYVSSIYLCVLFLIPLFLIFDSKKILILIVLFQMGGAVLNKSYIKAFDKFNIDLSEIKQKSDDITSFLPLLIKQCNKDINILTDNPSFEYHKLNITSKNIFQIFGRIEPDFFLESEFLKKSNSKNLKYFSHANVIILSKDSMWFDKSKINNPSDEFLLKSIETLSKMEEFGFKKYESKYFFIYINSNC